MLTGKVAERLLRLQGEHRDIGPAQLGPGDGRDPPRGGLLGVAPGGLDHDRGGVVERGFPGPLSGLVPAARGKPVQRRQQRAPEYSVVPLPDPEFPVRTPEFGQVPGERVRIILASGDSGQGLEETLALDIHGRREHCPDFTVYCEELGIEVCHCRISGRLEQPE
jgi:hypothetical protein